MHIGRPPLDLGDVWLALVVHCDQIGDVRAAELGIVVESVLLVG